jgi:hypothetical protein
MHAIGKALVLVLICAGSVTFLLSVLRALIKEAVDGPPVRVKVLWAKFDPPRRRGELMMVNFENQKSENRPGTQDVRIAL